MKKIIFGLGILIVLTSIACSVKQKRDVDKEVKVFLADFQNKLGNSNEEDILTLFIGSQSKDEILKAIAILQDRDSIVKTKVVFEESKSYAEESYQVVELPIEFSGEGQIFSKKSLVSFQLTEKNGKYFISKLEADRMHGAFLSLKNRIEHSDAYERWLARVTVFYNEAKELQRNYDSVVWYATSGGKTYYYVVNGEYNYDSLVKGALQQFKMGLIDKSGQVVVPAEYDLIGNPSMIIDGAVEVTKNGKTGFYSLGGRQIIPASFDWLVPYKKETSIALVKRDSAYGWFDQDFMLHQGFPSPDAERFISEFAYLTNNSFAFGRDHQDLINVLFPLTNGLYNGNGLVVSSSYFVRNGIQPAINREFITVGAKENLGQFGYEFEEDSYEKPFSISESIRAIISNIKSRFIGGRGEFYTSHRIILVDANRIVSSSFISSGSNFEFRKLDNELYESKAVYEGEMMGYFGPQAEEANFPFYSYFKFEGNQLVPLKSNRFFQFTEFVKMDSSYLSGDFFVWRSNGRDSTRFASTQTLQSMRDDILASYGFIFSSPERKEFYKTEKWYEPSTESYDEVYSKASEIDKYNLDFLNRIIGSTPGDKSM